VARGLLRRGGLAGLTMARIAEGAGCSRPAVYQYFPNRDEVVVALAIGSATLRNRLHARVATWVARPRERLIALAEVDAILHPDWPVLDETICANALKARAAPERREALRRAQQVAYDAHLACVRDAVAAGDLTLPQGLTDEQLVLTLTTFSVGLFAPLSRGVPHLEHERRDPRAAMHRVGAAFLDGLGWKPLTGECDYRQTMRHIYSEVYPPGFLAELGLVRPFSAPTHPTHGDSPASRPSQE
jgi:AcrR family transcriptional regulator